MVEATIPSTKPKELPKTAKQFQEQDFWGNFFRQREEKKTKGEAETEAFEWYCSYDDLEAYLKAEGVGSKTGEESGKILVPGCGNSTLSEMLVTKLG